MKHLFVIILSLFCISLVGCNQKTQAKHREEVKINLPTDNTVNGYATEKYVDSDIIDANNVTVESKKSETSSQSENQIQYCANLKSKVFHLNSCKSVKNMNQDNRFYSKDREKLIDLGYTPCSNCKP